MTLQAGKVQSNADVNAAFEWITASFPAPMAAAPAVLSQIQTHTGNDWVNTRHQSVTGAGFQIKMEEDGQDTAHNQETIGWIALPAGTGMIGGLTYEAIITPAAVTHVPYDIVSTHAFHTTACFPGMSLRVCWVVSDFHCFVPRDPCVVRIHGHVCWR